jgi:shikimate kinase
MKIIIFGFTGSGKTTHLKILKRDHRLENHEFIDLDSYILNLFDDYSSIKELILAKGWKFFRKVELDSIKNLLSRPQIVLALGGGSVSEDLIEFIRGIKNLNSVYLKTDFVTCWNRIKDDKNRPITLDGIEKCAVLYRDRMTLFKELESICISY